VLSNNELLLSVLRIFLEIQNNMQLGNQSTGRESNQKPIDYKTETSQPVPSVIVLLYIIVQHVLFTACQDFFAPKDFS
jgi:hypothetical protein